jgi:hypothetical protein
MWEPEPLTTLRASKACRGENFTFFLPLPARPSVGTRTPSKNFFVVAVQTDQKNDYMHVDFHLNSQRWQAQNKIKQQGKEK